MFLKKTWKRNPETCFLDPSLYSSSQLSSPSHDPMASKDVAPPTLLSLVADSIFWIFSSIGLQNLPGASAPMILTVFPYYIYPPDRQLNFSACSALHLKLVLRPHCMLLDNCRGKLNIFRIL